MPTFLLNKYIIFAIVIALMTATIGFYKLRLDARTAELASAATQISVLQDNQQTIIAANEKLVKSMNEMRAYNEKVLVAVTRVEKKQQDLVVWKDESIRSLGNGKDEPPVAESVKRAITKIEALK